MAGTLPALAIIAAAALSGCGPSRAELKERHERADYHYQLAFGFLFDPNPEARDGEMAFQECLKAVETDSEHAEAHFLLGLLLMGRERHMEAAEHYKKALAVKPDFLFAQNNLGATYLAMERWDDAIGVLTPLVMNPHFTTPANGYNNLGWAHYKKGHRAEARRWYTAALKHNSKLCPAYNNYALLLLDEGNEAEAREKLDEAIRRCPAYAEPYFHLGRIQVRTTERGLAAHSFQKCKDLSGDSPLAERCARQLSLLPAEESP